MLPGSWILHYGPHLIEESRSWWSMVVQTVYSHGFLCPPIVPQIETWRSRCPDQSNDLLRCCSVYFWCRQSIEGPMRATALLRHERHRSGLQICSDGLGCPGQSTERLNCKPEEWKMQRRERVTGKIKKCWLDFCLAQPWTRPPWGCIETVLNSWSSKKDSA